MATPESIHSTLLVRLASLLPENDSDYDALKTLVKGTKRVSPATMSKLKAPIDLLNEIEKRGVIGVGNYKFLQEFYTERDLPGGLECINQALNDMSGNAGYMPMNMDVGQQPHIPVPILAADSGLVSREHQGQPYAQKALHSNKEMDLAIGANSGIWPSVYFKEGDKVKGYVVIVNNFTEERQGTNQDAQLIRNFFEDTLNYTVLQIKDKPLADLEKILIQVQGNFQLGITDCNLLFLFILSHGDEKGIKTFQRSRTDESEEEPERIDIGMIASYFKSDKVPQLVDKPKLFFVQSCRGSEDQNGMEVVQTDDGTTPAADSQRRQPNIEQRAPKVTVPLDADILISRSTTEGYRSYRIPTGSWYITELISVFKEFHQRLPLMSMLTIVNERVAARDAIGEDIQINIAKQCPSHMTTLRKELFLLKNKK